MKSLNFDSISLTQALVRCPSITPKDEGALGIVEKYLKLIGFKSKKLTFNQEGSYEVNNLFASIGKNGKHLAFAGHTDVVPPGEEASWTYPPFSGTINNGRLYGRGSEDMKSSIACFISATNNFIEKYGKNFGGKISFIITGDEEKEAINGTKKIMEWSKRNDIAFDDCIVGEPTSEKIVGDKIKIGRRGSINFYIKVLGIQGHTANAHRAENPVHLMVNLLKKITSKPLDKGNKYFLPSSIQVATFDVDNSASNIIPEKASATINIRFNNKHDGQSLKKWLDKIIKNEFKKKIKAKCTYVSEVTGESFINNPGKLCNLINQVIKKENRTSKKPILATDGGTSDARFIKDYCEVVELGMINKTLHQINENVKINDLHKLTNIYFKILEKYFEKN